MYFEEKEVRLKDGRTAIFTSPTPADAEEMLAYLRKTSGETHFLLRTPEEVTMTIEEEKAFLAGIGDSETNVMIVCKVDGKIAGNCQISRKTKAKNRHRGSIGIAIMKEYWNLGIGRAMLQELTAIGKKWNLMQLELEVIEGNTRAMALYEKMGFQTVSYVPNAIMLPDGQLLKEYYMMKPL